MVTRPFKKKNEDNCLNWALDKWDDEGGYLVFRWCRHNKFPWIKWPHFMWLPKEHHIHLIHIVPIEKEGETHPFPSPWFDYEELHGDDKSIKEN